MKIKRGYYYIYYTLYRFVKFFPKPAMGIDFTAGISIISLQFFVIFSLLSYCNHLYNFDILLYNNLYTKLIVFAPILLINFSALSSEENGKDILLNLMIYRKRRKLLMIPLTCPRLQPIVYPHQFFLISAGNQEV